VTGAHNNGLDAKAAPSSKGSRLPGEVAECAVPMESEVVRPRRWLLPCGFFPKWSLSHEPPGSGKRPSRSDGLSGSAIKWPGQYYLPRSGTTMNGDYIVRQPIYGKKGQIVVGKLFRPHSGYDMTDGFVGVPTTVAVQLTDSANYNEPSNAAPHCLPCTGSVVMWIEPPTRPSRPASHEHS
jgi:hypothetical protein